MRMRCTVKGPRGESDVLIRAPAGTPLASVEAELAAAVGGAGPVFAADRRLSSESPLGVAPLIEGARLSFGPTSTDDAPSGRDGALLTVRVVGGPAAGAVHAVAPGRWRIGRGSDADIRLDADATVSRRHALLVVHAHGAVIRDTGSTNGSSVDGAPVGPDGTALTAGALLRVGDSTLTIAGPDEPPASVRPDGEGFVQVNRPPRLIEDASPAEIALPAAPVRPTKAKLPLASTLLPLAFGGALAWWQPQFALFMLLSPLMLVGNLVSDRIRGRRGYRRLVRDHDAATAATAARAAAELAEETQRRRRDSPDPAQLQVIAARPLIGLWRRRPTDADFLSIRLGTADLPASLVLRGPDGTTQHPPAPSVPVVVSLRDVGVLGIGGPRQSVEALARFVVGQLATLHSPHDLEIIVLTTRPEAWSWARWLPHVAAPAGGVDIVGPDAEAVAARAGRLLSRIGDTPAQPARMTGRPATIVLLDDARALRALPVVACLIADGPAAGCAAICLTTDPLDLPAECRSTAVLTGATGAELRLAGTGVCRVDDAIADLVAPEWADQVARALAPLRDGTPTEADALPPTAALLDLLGLSDPVPDEIRARWLDQPRSTEALIGIATTGPYAVDLRADGPHGLIAGTTGAGKSQLLQSLVASLAVANRPDELTFVLVDYKGGAAFADCARLPHTAGVVTDLDPQLTARALSSLDAELRGRERIMATAGCTDLEIYQQHGSPDGPLPRLVLIIDEFASLVEELPDFVAGLVDIARRGRSLGLHLLLATQRPSGVVSAEIRANTALRIALRVTDAGDSHDVIDAGHAATISPAVPGRAYVRTGSTAPTQIQVAHLGPRAADAGAAVTVEAYDWRVSGRAGPSSAPNRPTDLARLVDAVCAAAAHLQIARPHSPWLPPLPATVTVDELPGSAPHRLAIGLRDLPASQSQRPYELDLAGGGHLLVAGGPRSGRTTLLRTIAGAAGRLPVDDVHLYVLDCAGGGLLTAGELPHTGAAVGREDPLRGARVIDRLTAEIARRQALLARSGHGSLVEYRASRPPDAGPPWLVLLIDGWEGLVAAYDEIDHGRPVDAVFGLLRDGAAAGLRVLVTGGRAALTGRLATLVPDRLVLPLAEPGDYALAGIGTRQLPSRPRPGRGLVAGDPATEVQVALLDRDPSGTAQAAALRAVAAAARERTASVPPRHPPLRVLPLPVEVPYRPPISPPDRPLYADIGVGGDDARRVGVDLGDAGPGFLVAGPRGAGRTTALATIAASCAEYGTDVLLVAPPRSPLAALARSAGTRGLHGPFTPSAADQLAAALAMCERPVLVVVDDAETICDSAAEPVLLDLLQQATRRPAAVVLAGSPEDLAGRYRGLAAEVRRSGSGLLLRPSGPVAGDLLGITVSRGHPPLPGRGVLGLRGTATPVQVARIAAAEPELSPCADSASRWAG